MNIVKYVSLLHAGKSSGYIHRSGITGSSGSIMPSFRRNYQTDFQSRCTSLQSHQWRSVPFSTSLPAPVVLYVLDLGHSGRYEVKSQGCFDLISFMTKDVEHFFSCCSAIRYSSGENSFFSSVPHFLLGLFGAL